MRFRFKEVATKTKLFESCVVDGKVDPDRFQLLLQRIHHREWAMRLAMGDLGKDKPPGLHMRRGCPECGGYGVPGWIITKAWEWQHCACYDETKPTWPVCTTCHKNSTANTCGICCDCLSKK